MDQPGLSFSPFNQRPGQAAPGVAQSPVQDAIKILSFRMPSVVGASAPAPSGLLGGPTPQGAGVGGGLMQEFLKRLLIGQQATGGPSPAPSMPSMSSPMGLGQTNPFSASMGSSPSSMPSPDTSNPLPASVQFKDPLDRMQPPGVPAPPMPGSGPGGGLGGGGGSKY